MQDSSLGKKQIINFFFLVNNKLLTENGKIDQYQKAQSISQIQKYHFVSYALFYREIGKTELAEKANGK